MHAYPNRFIGTSSAIGLNVFGGPGDIRLTDNLVSGYGLGIQRSNEVRVMDQQNTFWANTQHAVGLVLDGSTRYVDK